YHVFLNLHARAPPVHTRGNKVPVQPAQRDFLRLRLAELTDVNRGSRYRFYLFHLRRRADDFHGIRYSLNLFHHVPVRRRAYHVRSHRDRPFHDRGDLEVDLRRTDPLDTDPPRQLQQISADVERGGPRPHPAEIQGNLLRPEPAQQCARPPHP